MKVNQFSNCVREILQLSLLLLSVMHLSRACHIHGTDSGKCTSDTLDESWRQENMPFCAKYVKYPACLPVEQPLEPSISFPNGRWKYHNTRTKDQWIEDHYNVFVAYRIGLERNKTLYRSGRNEYGDKGHIARRFYKRPNCRNAYRGYLCWINFPRCDMEKELSMPTCRRFVQEPGHICRREMLYLNHLAMFSACENFFRACQYAHDLWRCGKSKYFNGYSAESPRYVNGNATYLRDYFPGQPFRENKYNKNGHEEPICTPAMTGSGVRYHSIWFPLFFCLLVVFLLFAG